jgi:hypothetical protein
MECPLIKRPRIPVRGLFIYGGAPFRVRWRQAAAGVVALAALTAPVRAAENAALRIARVHYQGGGDWYNDPSCIPNLSRFLNQVAAIRMSDEEARIDLEDERFFAFPFLFLTGHGRVDFSAEEASRLRTYLENGGFLYADDDYGMDTSFRKAMEKVFPERSWQELPFSHGIYHVRFDFPDGPPKIHEHDDKPPRGYGLFDDFGRLMVYYTVESNVSDGWADADVHHDPEDVRVRALRMGSNIVIWAFMH